MKKKTFLFNIYIFFLYTIFFSINKYKSKNIFNPLLINQIHNYYTLYILNMNVEKVYYFFKNDISYKDLFIFKDNKIIDINDNLFTFFDILFENKIISHEPCQKFNDKILEMLLLIFKPLGTLKKIFLYTHPDKIKNKTNIQERSILYHFISNLIEQHNEEVLNISQINKQLSRETIFSLCEELEDYYYEYERIMDHDK